MKIKEMLRFFKKYFKSERKNFIKSFILIFFSSIMGILYGYLSGRAIDYASSSQFLLAVVFFLIIFGFNVLDHLVFHKFGRIYLSKVCNNMMESISYDVYYKVGLLPAVAFEEKSSGELINRVTQDSGIITDTFQFLLRIIVSLCVALVIFIYICFNSWIIAAEIIIYLIIFYLFSKKFLPKIKQKQKEISKEKDKSVAYVNESIRGIREIRALGVRKEVNGIVKKIITNIFSKINTQMINERSYNALVGALCDFLEVMVFTTCVILLVLNKTSFAFFASLTYHIYRFMGIVDQLMEFSTSYQKMKVAIERIDEIIDNKLYQDVEFGNINKIDIKGDIEFKNVTFKYKNEEKNIFENFNLSIPNGKKIALVGKSGQGKTSIFNLLLRYFEPNEGEILIDDIPLKDFSEDAFHQNIAIIRQDPFIFNKSILDNFKIVDKYISLKKIRNACKLAEIDDYIMSLPKKYDTIIGEGGVNLSGGQKQRMAIARALLKNSKIILFDEATSALDNENQAKIKEAIDNLVKDHTIVIVAHRLSTIVDADIIYLIDNGKVVASGLHKELLRKNKIYKTLYQNEEDVRK